MHNYTNILAFEHCPRRNDKKYTPKFVFKN